MSAVCASLAPHLAVLNPGEQEQRDDGREDLEHDFDSVVAHDQRPQSSMRARTSGCCQRYQATPSATAWIAMTQPMGERSMQRIFNSGLPIPSRRTPGG